MEGVYLSSLPLVDVEKYGAVGDGETDDQPAIQEAINAAGAAAAEGGGLQLVLLHPGRTYLIDASWLTLPSFVYLWAYGAKVIPTYAWSANPAIRIPVDSIVERIGVLGGEWDCSNASQSGQSLFSMAQPKLTLSGGVDVLLRDMYVHDSICNAIYIENATRVRILNNRLIDVVNGTAFSENAIHLQGYAGSGAGNDQLLQDILVQGNTVTGCTGGAIAMVQGQDGTVDLACRIIGNYCEGATDGSDAGAGNIAGAIDFEAASGATGFYRGISVIGNHVHTYSPTTRAINIATTNYFGRFKIIGNGIISAYRGVSTGLGSDDVCDVIVSGNRIDAPTPIAGNTQPGPLKTGNRYSDTGASQGQAVLVAGTVTVDTAEIQAGDNVILTNVKNGGAVGVLSVGATVAGTSFVIKSSSATDTSTVYWKIDH